MKYFERKTEAICIIQGYYEPKCLASNQPTKDYNFHFQITELFVQMS